jgi:hypothetical protein
VSGVGEDGGGIFTLNGGGTQLTLLNTIVFNPGSGAVTHDDVHGTVDQAQGNLFGSAVAVGGDLGGNQFHVNPLLGTLQNNDGPTATMALLPGSPGIGTGAGTSLTAGLPVPTTDQRYDARPDGAVDVGAFQTQPPAGFVRALYSDFLGRPASPAEASQWASALPALSQAGVARAISHSPEALTHAVDVFYARFLGRAAVGGEEAGWVAQLEGGATEEQVLAGILSSPEFAARANVLTGGGSADANYVQALYTLLLRRTASAAEINLWLGDLPKGRAAVALGVLGSQEYRGDAVTQFYATLLDRPTAPAAAEVTPWAASVLDLLALEMALASGPEYFQDG